MIVQFKQPQPIEAPAGVLDGAEPLRRTRNGALLAAALGFFCFIPYPALAIGNSSAVQIGNVLTALACIPILTKRWRPQNFTLYPLVLLALGISMMKVAVSGEGDLSLCMKTALVWLISTPTLMAVQMYAPAYALELLVGAAAATVLHTAVGVLQFYSFQQGEFPLAWLYENQSFLSVQDNAAAIARFTQRPFGIFPEPSAMSSSLAPWVLLWFGYLFGLVRFIRTPALWQRRLFAAAAGGGLGLIILSRSGHASVTVASLLLFVVAWFFRARSSARAFFGLIVGLGIVLPLVLWFAAVSLGDRLGGSAELGNSSWQDRGNSLRIGFEVFMDSGIGTIIFGMGPGQTTGALMRAARLEAVWSVLLAYLYETGLLGFIVVCSMGRHLARLWRSTGYDLVFICIVTVWTVGVTLTTSYSQLLPLWFALAWLTVWPEVCRAARKGEKVSEARLPRERQKLREIGGMPGGRWGVGAETVSVGAGRSRRWAQR